MDQTSKDELGHFFDSPVRVAAAFVVAIVGIVGLITVLLGAWRPDVEPSDFAADYASARAWSQGVDPYGDTPTLEAGYVDAPLQKDIRGYTSLHPPIDILIVWPFSRLHFREAYDLWMIVMAAAMMWALFKFARANGLGVTLAVPMALGVLALPTTRLALHNGEPNPLVLSLLVGAWLLLRAERNDAAGFVLGIATAMRIFPALLLFPLLRMKRYRTAAWQAATATIVTAGAGLVLGVGASKHWLSGGRADVTFWRAAGHNISLLAIPFRWLTPNVWFPGGPNLSWLATALALCLLGGGLYLAWRTPASTSSDFYWATVPFMIVLTPVAWADYLVLTIPLVILLLRGMGRRVALPVILGMIGVVIGRPIFAFRVNPVSVARQVVVLSIPLYGLLLLAVSDWIPNPNTRDSNEGATLTGYAPFGSSTP